MFQRATANSYGELYQDVLEERALLQQGYVLVRLPARLRVSLNLPYRHTRGEYYYPLWVLGVWDRLKTKKDKYNEAVEELRTLRDSPEEQLLLLTEMQLAGYPYAEALTRAVKKLAAEIEAGAKG